MKIVTPQQLFETIGSSYLELIHLKFSESKHEKILQQEPYVSDAFIAELLLKHNWRGRLVGLCLACKRGLNKFYDTLLECLGNNGISVIPTAAVIAICVNHYQCDYTTSMTTHLDRNLLDGELGFALDKLHFLIGVTCKSVPGSGPNYGQVFEEHYRFYLDIAIH